jgi:hypothetical protein
MTGSATPWRQLFVLPRDGASPAFPNNAERFYSFDYGPVHFVVLDTESASCRQLDGKNSWPGWKPTSPTRNRSPGA